MKRDNKHSKKELQQVIGDWDIYYNDNKDASTHVNKAYKKLAPIKTMPTLARVKIKMKNPRVDGLSTEHESEFFNKFVLPIANTCNANNNAIHVAHYTGGGKWIVYFYCDDIDLFKETVRDVLAGFADFQYDIDFQEDKEWKVYSELYPTERQFRSTSNLRLILQLVQLGVDLSQPREVEHTLFFRTKADRNRFVKTIKKQGFTVCDKFHENSLKSYPYGLEISRVDKVDWKSADEHEFQLMEIAKQHHGFHDGWAIFTTGNEI